MKISVITPSYNSGKYIEKAILSVQNQSYKNWEHIIIDGGSTDDTIDLLKKHPHLIWISEKDRGQSDAMNKGFSMSTGDIIVYLNADDWFEEEIFGIVMDGFDQFPNSDVILGNVIQEFDSGPIYIQSDYALDLEEILFQTKKHPYNPVGYFYKRELQHVIGKFPLDEHYAMDYWFLLRLYHFGKLKKINENFGTFFMTGENKTMITNSKNSKESIALKFADQYYHKRKNALKLHFLIVHLKAQFNSIRVQIGLRTRILNIFKQKTL